MKKRVLATMMVFSLMITTILSVAVSEKGAAAKKNRWGGDEMDDCRFSYYRT